MFSHWRLSVFICGLFFLTSCGSHEVPVDTIWTARYVVTMDPARRIVEDGAVAIAGDHIVEAFDASFL